MKDHNLFVVGRTVQGKSQIGYARVLENLRDLLLRSQNSVSLMGLHRMGKTSLMLTLDAEVKAGKYDKFLSVFVDINECRDLPQEGRTAYDDMLFQIVHELKRSLRRCPDFRDRPQAEVWQCIADFMAASPQSMLFRSSFKDVFEALAFDGWHVLLTLDEFDRAQDFFLSNADFELFRTLGRPEYQLSMVFISRRQLARIEMANCNNSTFFSSVTSIILKGFGAEDCAAYYQLLQDDYALDLPLAERKKLEYYAGTSPYLYSIFGYELAAAQLRGEVPAEMEELYQHRAAEIIHYAELIYSRLDGDGNLAKLAGIIIGPMLGVTLSDKELLVSLGYLGTNSETDSYEAVSGYFTDYMRSREVPSEKIWENILALERKCKSLVRRELEAERTLSASEWKAVMGAAYRRAGQPYFDPTQYECYIGKNLVNFHKQTTMLDVMSLKDVAKILRLYWQDAFEQYFDNTSFEQWEQKLLECGKGRDPLAHDHPEYLTETRSLLINGYCQEILQLIEKNQGHTVHHPLQIPAALPMDTGMAGANLQAEKSSVQEAQAQPLAANISAENVGYEGVLQDVRAKHNSRGGLIGTILGEAGTVSQALLTQAPAAYEGKDLQVKIIGINPQGNQYLVRPL